MSTQPTATPNGDAAASNVGASSATGTAKPTAGGTNDKNVSASSATENEAVEYFDTAASSKAWTVPAAGVEGETDAEFEKALAVQEADAEKRAKDATVVITREPIEGVGGESFNVAVGEEASSLAYTVQREDDAQRREDANRIVFRSPDKRIGGTSFDVG